MTTLDLHEIPGDRKAEAQASAPPVARTVAPEEAIEHVCQILTGNPRPRILDDDADSMRLIDHAGQSHAVPRWRRSNGVAQKIGNRPVEKLTVEVHLHTGVKLV